MTLPKVSVLIGTGNRPEALRRCVESVLSQTYEDLEIVVLDNSPRIDSCEQESEILADDQITCHHVNENLGVAKSRNWLMNEASGDVFVVIDDDAYFENESAVRRIVDGFGNNVGIQAFKIIDHPDGSEPRILAPIPQSHAEKGDLDEGFRTSYFVGGGHAIRREVIEKCGDYNPDLVYGAEELDLSYRAVEAGFEIEYNPRVVVHHHPEPPIVRSDKPGNSELYYSVRNKLYIAYRYLPRKYVPSYVLIWLGYYAVKSLQQAAPLTYLRGVLGGIEMCKSSKRSPVSSETVRYLKANHGRLWY